METLQKRNWFIIELRFSIYKHFYLFIIFNNVNQTKHLLRLTVRTRLIRILYNN